MIVQKNFIIKEETFERELFGNFDENIKLIEEALKIDVILREGNIVSVPAGPTPKVISLFFIKFMYSFWPKVLGWTAFPFWVKTIVSSNSFNLSSFPSSNKDNE